MTIIMITIARTAVAVDSLRRSRGNERPGRLGQGLGVLLALPPDEADQERHPRLPPLD